MSRGGCESAKADDVPFDLSCVIDEHPRFFVELVLWVICARRYLPCEKFALSVYFVGSPPPDLAHWLGQHSIEARRTEPVVAGSPHCNKIAPFLSSRDGATTLVCDADLYFVDDLSVFLRSRRFRAAPNNHCNPPPAVFEALLEASQLGRPYRPGIALFKGDHGLRETHANNISGGLIVAPPQTDDRFPQTWMKWARWLVEHKSLLGRWAGHVDQVAFALTMEEFDEDVEFLPPQCNVVLHGLDEIWTACAFHLTTGHLPAFPHLFRPDRTMVADGLPEGVTHAVHRFNDCVGEAMNVIQTLPSTRDHVEKFLNPAWHR